MMEVLRIGGTEAMKRVISKERNDEISREVWEYISKQCRDHLLAYEAVKFVRSVRK